MVQLANGHGHDRGYHCSGSADIRIMYGVLRRFNAGCLPPDTYGVCDKLSRHWTWYILRKLRNKLVHICRVHSKIQASGAGL